MPKPTPLTMPKKVTPAEPPPSIEHSPPRKDYGEAMNLRLPRPVAKRFRQMALDHDKKLNEMFIELVSFYDAQRDRH